VFFPALQLIDFKHRFRGKPASTFPHDALASRHSGNRLQVTSMRLGGRLSAAIDILSDIETRHRPASEALRDWGLSHRFAGAADRAAIGNLVYDALRRRLSAAWLTGSDTPRALIIGAFLLRSRMVPEALNAALAEDRFAPPLLDAEECAIAASRLAETIPDMIRAEAPDWCSLQLREQFGAQWADEGAALAERPPLDMRVNTLIAERQRVLRDLAPLDASPSRLAPHGLRIAPVEGDGRHPNVQAEPAFRKGWIEVQDEGSQLAAHLAGARAGMQVLDYCAGAGGKTLALAAAMDNRGQIHAHDADRHRLAPIFERLARARVRNVQVMPPGSDLAPLEGRMDLVLVDAPCSGSGTWRRRPDAKWRLTARQLDQRREEQAALLAEASHHVRPGGRLVYVTCSIFAEENEEQVARFVTRRPDFRPVDHQALWGRAVAGQEDAVRSGPYGLLMTPARSGTDGFFVAILERVD
jgi:16S rRNA (cytosine967-C5)-methyltransferase